MEGTPPVEKKRTLRAERSEKRWIRMSGRALHDAMLAGAAIAFVYLTGDRAVDLMSKSMQKIDAKLAAAESNEKRKRAEGPVFGKPGLNEYTFVQVRNPDGSFQPVAVPTKEFKEDVTNVPRKEIPK